MSLLDETRNLLKSHNIIPNQHLGQNFCVDFSLMNRMIEHAKVNTSDTVLEIGSGLGSLTNLLSMRACKVIAVEVDPRLTRLLFERFKEKDNVEIIGENVLEIPLPRYDKIVSNPPYSISSKLLVRILEKPEKLIVMTVQREFAEKLTAMPRSKEYGWLSVIVERTSSVEVLDTVSKEAFFPQPKVESVVLRIKTGKQKYKLSNEDLFQDLVKHLFKNRNKKVKNSVYGFLALKTGIQKKQLKSLIEELVNIENRPRNMNVEELIRLANEIDSIFIRSKKLVHNNHVIYVFPEVYFPSEDTYLLVKHVKPNNDDVVLDMGTGSGILAIQASKHAKRVIATDINPQAIRCANLNIKLNKLNEKIEVRRGDLFKPIEDDELFDLIIFNPPYLPVEEGEGKEWLEKSWNGGVDGRKTINRFLDEFRYFLNENGSVLMIQSSLSNNKETDKKLRKQGFQTELLEEKKLDFETLTVLKAARRK